MAAVVVVVASTARVEPSLHVDYKHSRIKQYHREGRALRTETIINDSYDFAVGRRLSNFDQLKELGFSTNRRLLCVQRLSHNCVVAFTNTARCEIGGSRSISRRTAPSH